MTLSTLDCLVELVPFATVENRVLDAYRRRVNSKNVPGLSDYSLISPLDMFEGRLCNAF